jgi:hypothetical protein
MDQSSIRGSSFHYDCLSVYFGLTRGLLGGFIRSIHANYCIRAFTNRHGQDPGKPIRAEDLQVGSARGVRLGCVGGEWMIILDMTGRVPNSILLLLMQ